jgi:preprotein translocase subunit SecA
LFERLLVLIREEITKTLMRADIQIQDPSPPPLPDFITTHFDPLSGDDDTMDFDMGSLIGGGEAAPRAAPLPPLPEDAPPPESRNAPCPCGSGRKFKHCHGALA